MDYCIFLFHNYHPHCPARSHYPRLIAGALSLLVSVYVLTTASCFAEATPRISEKQEKLPRYASLGVAKAALRVGPSRAHPIEWIFVKKGMPVEILQSFDHWHKIRDHEGSEGWIHAAKISAARTVLATRDLCPVRREPVDAAPAIAVMEKTSITSVRQCKAEWCEIVADDVRGWVSKSDIWGVYPQEAITAKRCWIPYFCR